jgi:hypothetical protein
MCSLLYQELLEKVADCFDRFPDMFTSVGVAASAGVAAALIIGVSIFPTMFIQWRGQKLRGLVESDSDMADQAVSAKV